MTFHVIFVPCQRESPKRSATASYWTWWQSARCWRLCLNWASKMSRRHWKLICLNGIRIYCRRIWSAEAWIRSGEGSVSNRWSSNFERSENISRPSPSQREAGFSVDLSTNLMYSWKSLLLKSGGSDGQDKAMKTNKSTAANHARSCSQWRPAWTLPEPKTSGLRQTDMQAAGSEHCVARCRDPAGWLAAAVGGNQNVPTGRRANGRWRWKLACALVAIFGFIATVTSMFKKQFDDRLAQGNQCVGKLLKLDLEITTGVRDWDAAAKEYGEIVKTFPEFVSWKEEQKMNSPHLLFAPVGNCKINRPTVESRCSFEENLDEAEEIRPIV